MYCCQGMDMLLPQGSHLQPLWQSPTSIIHASPVTLVPACIWQKQVLSSHSNALQLPTFFFDMDPTMLQLPPLRQVPCDGA
jgi:hypothetical protein